MVIQYEDIKGIIKSLQIYYPNSFKSFGPDEFKMLSEQWYSILKNCKKEFVFLSVKEYMSKPNEFAPNAGQIYDYIHRNPEYFLKRTIKERYPELEVHTNSKQIEMQNEEYKRKFIELQKSMNGK